jgi:glyoxylate carboligase
MYVLISGYEKHRGWKAIGIAGGLALAIFSQSRLALVALAVIAPFVWAASRMDRGYLWLVAAPVVFCLGCAGPDNA